MKKNNLSIKAVLVKFIGEICNQVCINLLETSLLANALYENQDLIESDLTNSFPKSVPFPF